MIDVLIAMRDVVVVWSLAWVGVSVDRQAEPAATQSQGASSCAEGHLCPAQRPRFNALDCEPK